MSKPRGHLTSRRSTSTSVEQHPFPDRRNFAERTAALSAPAHRLHQVILQAFLRDGCASRLADLDVQVLSQQRAVREARKIFGAVLQEAAAADTWAIAEPRPSPVPKHQPAGRREEY